MNGDTAAPVLPGETLAGKYRVERILGKGGMGIVVAARHLELDERVAIKFLLRKDDRAAVERFIREARAAAKVKSEHVCRVYDVSRLETGEPYLVMEYLDGVDLADRVRSAGRLPLSDVARWIIEVCAALAEAHALGIIHRDLKPANVFLAKRPDEMSTVKVLDFGISKLTADDAITSTTAVIGTPIYMSPEQVASARDVDARTDIWSLGVIMYELVSGKPPFAGDSLIQLSVKIREAELPPLESGDAHFDEVVARCLAKDREARWSSVGELAVALAPFAGGASAALAQRVTRTLGAAKAALAETLPDPRDEHPTPAAAPEQATLEPLSTAQLPDDRSKRASPFRAGIPLAIAAGSLLVLARLATRDAATPPPPSVPSAVADALPTPTADPTTSASAAPPTRITTPITTTTSSAAPKADIVVKPQPTVTIPVVADASTPVVATPTSAEPAPTTIKKKRQLDRDDPYTR